MATWCNDFLITIISHVSHQYENHLSFFSFLKIPQQYPFVLVLFLSTEYFVQENARFLVILIVLMKSKLMKLYNSICCYDIVLWWPSGLRRWTLNPMGHTRAGSNPAHNVFKCFKKKKFFIIIYSYFFLSTHLTWFYTSQQLNKQMALLCCYWTANSYGNNWTASSTAVHSVFCPDEHFVLRKMPYSYTITVLVKSKLI